MTTKKKAAGLTALKSINAPETASQPDTPNNDDAPKRTRAQSRTSTKKTNTTRKTTRTQATSKAPSPTLSEEKKTNAVFSLHLPSDAHEKLREISFHERISMTKLINEGIDLLFEKRGIPPISSSNK